MKHWFKEPFEYFRIRSDFRRLPGEKETIKDCYTFPNNIKEYIWGEEGGHDEGEWNLLAKLKNGKYIFFTAWCDYTGFDCQSGIKLYVAKDIVTLVDKAMDKNQRKAYLESLINGEMCT